jgi:elongation factor G
MYADRREDVDEVLAGDIGAVLGLKDSFTGDTCAIDQPDPAREHHLPRAGDLGRDRAEDHRRPGQDGEALRKLSEEDPTFRVRSDQILGRRSFRDGRAAPGGAGGPHAARVPGSGRVGRPQVAYRESITRPVPRSITATSSRPAAAASTVTSFLSLSLASRAGILYENDIVGGVIPKELLQWDRKRRRKPLRPVCWPGSR